MKAKGADLANIQKKAKILKQLNIDNVKVKSLTTNGNLHVDKLTNVNAEG